MLMCEVTIFEVLVFVARANEYITGHADGL